MCHRPHLHQRQGHQTSGGTITELLRARGLLRILALFVLTALAEILGCQPPDLVRCRTSRPGLCCLLPRR